MTRQTWSLNDKGRKSCFLQFRAEWGASLSRSPRLLPSASSAKARPCCAADESATTPTEIPLWPNGTPGAKGTDPDKDVPTLTICLPKPETATGAAVVVCPGGGYGMLAVDHEGKQVAEWLNSLGVAAFILKYRLGRAIIIRR